jgi:hypothetical protein
VAGVLAVLLGHPLVALRACDARMILDLLAVQYSDSCHGDLLCR